jgi:hypothetical protein
MKILRIERRAIGFECRGDDQAVKKGKAVSIRQVACFFERRFGIDMEVVVPGTFIYSSNCLLVGELKFSGDDIAKLL